MWKSTSPNIPARSAPRKNEPQITATVLIYRAGPGLALHSSTISVMPRLHSSLADSHSRAVHARVDQHTAATTDQSSGHFSANTDYWRAENDYAPPEILPPVTGRTQPIMYPNSKIAFDRYRSVSKCVRTQTRYTTLIFPPPQTQARYTSTMNCAHGQRSAPVPDSCHWEHLNGFHFLDDKSED